MHQKNDWDAFDLDELRENAPRNNSQPVAASITIQLTPKKIFFGGVVAGIFAMSVPLAFVIAKGGEFEATNALSAATAPTPPAPQPIAPTKPSSPGTIKPINKDDYIRGNSNAEISLIEYSDFECPFCKRFHPTAQKVVDEYKGKVNWVYRHFPLSFHANAQKEAEAAECAGELGGNDAFWKYTDAIMERTISNGSGFPLENLTPLAKELGLNEKKFKDCVESGRFASRIQQALSEGQAAGVDGTPGNILLTKEGKSALVLGAVSFEEIKIEIDKLLAK